MEDSTTIKREETEKHPIEQYLEKHIIKISVAAVLFIISFFIAVTINGILATYIFGPFFLLAFITGIILNLVVYAGKVRSFKEFIFSKNMFNTLFVIGIISLTLYLGRGEIMDYPHYINKDFEVYKGSPREIDVIRRTGRGPGSSTLFTLDSGKVLIYKGIIEDLNQAINIKSSICRIADTFIILPT
ncbi:hypothetical protein [Neobacillus sp. D3-1R]|uniref:hypothetical protein n=1 Tax=Neobacillus sp. D3-1R TaxID=3445778 RepID=UPI003FA10E09